MTVRAICRAPTTADRLVSYRSDERRTEGVRRSRREVQGRANADPGKRATAAACAGARCAARKGAKGRRHGRLDLPAHPAPAAGPPAL